MRFLLIAIAALVLVEPAFSQRADDNALTEAQDAFGMTVGTENIGLYTPDEVRGFSALDAGNARLDGLYFDPQIDLTDHIVDSTAIRVGISAQGYPLPAPTGIVDYKLRRPGDKQLVSTVLGYGAFDGRFISLDAQLPVVENKLSLGLGGKLGREIFEFGAGESVREAAAIVRWRPTRDLDIVPFWNRQTFDSDGSRPALFVAGSYLPQEYRRGNYFGQRWNVERRTGDTFGVLAEAALSEAWSLKAGLFRSVSFNDGKFAELYRDAQPDNTARYEIVADPPQRFASTSGEIRIARAFVSKSVFQSLQLALRSRDQRRRYGGSDVWDMGVARIGEAMLIERPDFTFGAQTRDQVRQNTLGAAYYVRWPDVAEINVGLQKAHYRKAVTQPDPEGVILGQDRPVLFNIGSTIHAGEALSFYASYSRGLEEGAVAPAAAINKDSAPPAIRTVQMDGGMRYELTPDLRVIAGVFDIQKPYFSLDTQSLYRELGDERHRGVEISLSGELTPQASIAVGAVLMRPRVEGELVDSGTIGRKPVGQTHRTVMINGEYRFVAIPGFSIDTNIASFGSRVASSDNSLEIPARMVTGIGARYQFTLGRAQSSVHAHVGNVFNNFGWRTNASGVFEPNAQRHFWVNFAADF